MDKLNQLKEGDVLVLAGSIPSSMSDNIYRDIMADLKDRGVMIVVDATSSLLMNVLKYKPFLIKPNQDELGDIFGVTLSTREEVIPYALRLKSLKMKLGLYREFLQTASDVVPRGLRTEIRIVSTVKVSQMQKQVDDMSRDLRLLEETIQGLNWTTELQ